MSGATILGLFYVNSFQLPSDIWLIKVQHQTLNLSQTEPKWPFPSHPFKISAWL